MGGTTPPIHIYHRPPFASMIDAFCEKENILCFPPKKKKERKWNLVAQTNYVIWSICQLIQWAVFICILAISVTDPSISCKCIYSRVEIPRCFARRLITYQFLSPGMGKPLLRRYPLGWSRFFPLPPMFLLCSTGKQNIHTHTCTHIHAHTYKRTHTYKHTHRQKLWCSVYDQYYQGFFLSMKILALDYSRLKKVPSFPFPLMLST